MPNSATSNAKRRIESLWQDPPKHDSLLGTNGYFMPSIEGFEWVSADERDNWILAPANMDWRDERKFTFYPEATGNVVVFSRESKAGGEFRFRGIDSTVIVGGGARGDRINAYVNAVQSILFFGERSTSNYTSFFLQGTNRRVIVGEDCMFSHGIAIRNNDDHAIIDMNDGSWINKMEDIYIEPVVWLGPEVVVLKGVEIGLGSIVAQRSVVSKDVPRFSMVAGVPARTIRSDVVWGRAAYPDPDRVERVRAKAATVSMRSR